METRNQHAQRMEATRQAIINSEWAHLIGRDRAKLGHMADDAQWSMSPDEWWRPCDHCYRHMDGAYAREAAAMTEGTWFVQSSANDRLGEENMWDPLCYECVAKLYEQS